ncbi:hypothetical protein ACSQ67_015894 [Phaseolus vulgaris]
MDSKDVNGCIMDKHKPVVVASTLGSEKVEDHVNGDDESDSNSLLPPRRGGMSRNSDKTRRKVQWNDRNGNKLAEVLEYEPRSGSCAGGVKDVLKCTKTFFKLPSLISPKERQRRKTVRRKKGALLWLASPYFDQNLTTEHV